MMKITILLFTILLLTTGLNFSVFSQEIELSGKVVFQNVVNCCPKGLKRNKKKYLKEV